MYRKKGEGSTFLTLYNYPKAYSNRKSLLKELIVIRKHCAFNSPTSHYSSQREEKQNSIFFCLIKGLLFQKDLCYVIQAGLKLKSSFHLGLQSSWALSVNWTTSIHCHACLRLFLNTVANIMHQKGNGNGKPFSEHWEQDKTTCFAYFHKFVLEVLAISNGLDKEIKTSNLEMNKENYPFLQMKIPKNL